LASQLASRENLDRDKETSTTKGRFFQKKKEKTNQPTYVRAFLAWIFSRRTISLVVFLAFF
jgi:hypothetical protein